MILRTRLAVGLLSFAVIGLELALMRILSLRFWYYFAAMVISVALLGFGFSGTLLTLIHRRLGSRRRLWLASLAFAASWGVLFCAWAVQFIPLDVHYLAWSLGSEWFHILAIELLMLLPFLLSGGFLGLVLMDRSDRIHGHYAANLIGSGAGALLSVLLMVHVSTAELILVLALLCYGAGAFLTQWTNSRAALGAVVVGVLWIAATFFFPAEIRISPYKKLALERAKPQTQLIHRAEGPLGRIDIVQGPSVHDAPPGMSLNNPHPIPERTLVIVDGDQTHIVYNYLQKEDWRFLDYTTAAALFAVKNPSQVLVIGPGGGAPLALAHLKGAQKIDALAGHRQMVEIVTKRLADKGGSVYRLSGVRTHFEQMRGYLRRTGERYDHILQPLLDSAGGGGAGLDAAQENYLYTVESFRSIIGHLKTEGIFCATVAARNPPRDGLRIFNVAAEALRRENLDPSVRLALIRSWETVTLLVQKSSWTKSQLKSLRAFADSRGFDIGYLPGLAMAEVNRFHILPQPYYYEGTRELLGPERRRYVADYLFALEAPTDDRPYFNHFIRWKHLPELRRRLQGRMPAFLELGSLLMATALVQVAVLAAVLIFIPLVPKFSALRGAQHKGRVLLYFFLLGMGFMQLEMGFLQKMILYLAHPIYSAAAVIAAFLVFAGIGSQWSAAWNPRASAAAGTAAVFVGIMGFFYLFRLDAWLMLTQSWNLALRFVMTILTIAPLALVMGCLFPMGLRRVSAAVPALAPWSWAVNGFASVMATVSAPLLAMSFGFSKLILAALACYLMAGFLFALLPRGSDTTGLHTEPGGLYPSNPDIS